MSTFVLALLVNKW